MAVKLQKPPYVFFGGKLRSWDEANFHISTEAVVRGLNVFEGLKAYWQRDGSIGLVAVERHWRRLQRSARLLHIPFEMTLEDFEANCHELVAKLCRLRQRHLGACHALRRRWPLGGGHRVRPGAHRLSSAQSHARAPRHRRQHLASLFGSGLADAHQDQRQLSGCPPRQDRGPQPRLHGDGRPQQRRPGRRGARLLRGDRARWRRHHAAGERGGAREHHRRYRRGPRQVDEYPVRAPPGRPQRASISPTRWRWSARSSR